MRLIDAKPLTFGREKSNAFYETINTLYLEVTL